jgi:hypothetical protein
MRKADVRGQRRRRDDAATSLFFNAAQLPAPTEEYVAWVDVMGTQASMSTSLRTAANFMFKLHIAAFQAPRERLRIYPVMDGFYAAAPGKADMLNFLRAVFAALGHEFNVTEENRFRFIVRGGLAFGPSIHGVDVPAAASTVVADARHYRDSILLGMPMVQAHVSEAEAPPFGLFVHESARAFAQVGQQPLHDRWWRWDEFGNEGVQQTWAMLHGNLKAYFDWCTERSLRIGYALDRINAHRTMASQYFA